MDKENSKGKFKNSIGIITIIIFIGIITIMYLSKGSSSDNVRADINVKETIAKGYYVNSIKKYTNVNSDVVGVIEMDNTPINYPILQAQDNDYYLYRNIDKIEDKNGSIFLDCINENDFSDVNTVIYGHSMKDKSMFGSLESFRNQEFTDANLIIKIYTDTEVLEYKIFSVYVTEPDYPYRIKKFNNEDEITQFINNITSKSLIKSDVKPTVHDKILTLSTCAYDFDDARLAIHAILLQ